MDLLKLYEIDQLQLYFGNDFKINEHLIIRQPTIGDIVDMGERNYFSMVHTLTAIPSDLIAQLSVIGLDWNKVEDFELFSMLITSMDIDETRVLFGNLDFSKFRVVPIEGERRHILHHEELDFDMDELMYGAMARYLCMMHGIKKKPQYAGNEATKQMMIEMAIEDMERAKKKPYVSQLKSLISTMVNSAGFKYNIEQVRDMKLCQFMDSVSRIQIISSATALLHGCYSGMIDTKKIDKDGLNTMKDIDV